MTSATTSSLSPSLGLLILRVGFGGYMLTHGWGKVEMLFGGNGANFPDPLGMGGTMSLVMASGAEFGCAILLVLGLATRLAAVPLVFTMLVAAFVVHGQDPWTMGEGARLFKAGEAQSWSSKEAAMLYLIPFAALVFTGGGRLSVDAWWRERKGRGGA